METQEVKDNLVDLNRKFEDVKNIVNSTKAESVKKEQLEKVQGAMNAFEAKHTEHLNEVAAEKKETDEKIKNLEAAIKRAGNVEGDIGEKAAKAVEEFKLFSLSNPNQSEKKSFYMSPEFKTLSMDNDVSAGFFLPMNNQGRMVKQTFQTSPMETVANVTVINDSNAQSGLIDDGDVTGSVECERTESSNDTTPEVGEWRLSLTYAKTLVKATAELLRTVPSVTSWLENKTANKRMRMKNARYITGDTNNYINGILSYPEQTGSKTTLEGARAYERGKVSRLATGTADKVDLTDLLRLRGCLKSENSQNARYFFNDLTLNHIQGEKDDQGRFQWQAPTDNAPGMIWGKPYIIFNDMPGSPDGSGNFTTGNLVAGYGDLDQAYQILKGAGLHIVVDPYSSKPKVEFMVREGFAGGVIGFDFIKLLEVA